MLELAEACRGRGGLAASRTCRRRTWPGDHQRGASPRTTTTWGQGFNNTYERSKWEAERLASTSAARSCRCRSSGRASSSVTSAAAGPPFNVIYTPLRMYARGALPLIPARRSAPVDIVPVSYVARSILALDDAGAGRPSTRGGARRTDHGRADRPSRSAIFDGPPIRTVSPAVYRRTIEPVLARALRRLSDAGSSRARSSFLISRRRRAFKADATRAALEPLACGRRCSATTSSGCSTSRSTCRLGRAQAWAGPRRSRRRLGV